LATTAPPVSAVKEATFNPISINFADELSEVTAQDLVVNNVNNFDNLINFNIVDENLKNFSNLDENFNNLDGSEIITQLDQIIKLNENFVDTVNTVISVSGLELNEKITSLFQLFHLDISTIF
jgi:hypothetical protein